MYLIILFEPEINSYFVIFLVHIEYHCNSHIPQPSNNKDIGIMIPNTWFLNIFLQLVQKFPDLHSALSSPATGNRQHSRNIGDLFFWRPAAISTDLRICSARNADSASVSNEPYNTSDLYCWESWAICSMKIALFSGFFTFKATKQHFPRKYLTSTCFRDFSTVFKLSLLVRSIRKQM